MFDELRNSCRPGNVGGFLPGMKQIGNVAALPGIIGVRIVFSFIVQFNIDTFIHLCIVNNVYHFSI